MPDLTNSNEGLRTDLQGKYLSLRLKEEFYGIKVESILQIIAIPEITPIPKTPEYIKGVINLRGKIIPVIDLRLRFSLPFRDYDERNSIVILRIKNDHKEILLGLIVDNVQEVIDISAEKIEDSPTFGIQLDTDYILGMAKINNKVITLLNVTNILTKQELKALDKAAK